MQRMAVLLTLALGWVVACLGSSLPTDLVRLVGDDVFEHQTQAATGQTTGVWFVLFTASSNRRHTDVMELWTTLAADEEKEVIYAVVDLALKQNLDLAKRFEHVQPPSAVLFRDRKMYVYPRALDADNAEESIQQFISEGYAQQEAQQVPTPYRASFNTASVRDAMAQSGRVSYSNIFFGVGMLVLGAAVRGIAKKQAGASQAAGEGSDKPEKVKGSAPAKDSSAAGQAKGASSKDSKGSKGKGATAKGGEKKGTGKDE